MERPSFKRSSTQNLADSIVGKLQDPRQLVRSNAAEALGKLGDAAAPYAGEIAAALKDEAWVVRSCAAQALGAIGPAGAPYVQDLARILNDEHADVRKHAATALGKVGQEPVTPFLGELAALLDDADRSVRMAATRALSAMGPLAAPYAKDLARALEEKDSGCVEMRADAAKALGASGSAAVPYLGNLGRALNDEHPNVRREAALAIGKHSTSALPFMVELGNALTDQDLGVQSAAQTALEELSPSLQPLRQLVVEIPSGEIHHREGTTFFTLVVTQPVESDANTWRVQRRYNQFANLKGNVGKLLASSEPFPAKTLGNCTGEKLELRRVGLKSWVDALFRKLNTRIRADTEDLAKLVIGDETLSWVAFIAICCFFEFHLHVANDAGTASSCAEADLGTELKSWHGEQVNDAAEDSKPNGREADT